MAVCLRKPADRVEHTNTTGGVHLAMRLLSHRDNEMKPGASKCRGVQHGGLCPATTTAATPVAAGPKGARPTVPPNTTATAQRLGQRQHGNLLGQGIAEANPRQASLALLLIAQMADPIVAEQALVAYCPDLVDWPRSWRIEPRDVAPGSDDPDGLGRPRRPARAQGFLDQGWAGISG